MIQEGDGGGEYMILTFPPLPMKSGYFTDISQLLHRSKEEEKALVKGVCKNRKNQKSVKMRLNPKKNHKK